MLLLWRLNQFCLLRLGQALTPAGPGSAPVPRIHKRHRSEGQLEARGSTLLDHTAVEPVSLCNAREFCECIHVNAAVTPASVCLTFSLQKSEGELQEDPPLLCIFAGSPDRNGGITEPGFKTSGVSLTK